MRYSLLALLLIVLIVSCLSCSSTRYLIKKNQRKSDKLINKLLRDHDNAFCLGSTYMFVSYVWSYQADQLFIYRIYRGRVDSKKQVDINNPQILDESYQTGIHDLNNCAELDGDYIAYYIKYSDNLIHDRLPVNGECFVNLDHDSALFRLISDDMVKYEIKWW